jgi:predicted N-formylglutamate amidohydrolase
MSRRVTDARPTLILTCEHARNRIPREFRSLFEGKRHLLETHRGYDLGALQLAERLADIHKAPLFASDFTRLVCDLNRSPGNPSLFSEFTRNLPSSERNLIIQSYYYPHRMAVEAAIRRFGMRKKGVIHVGVHTFTPNLNGRYRGADVGLLYDPQRLPEKEFCRRWQQSLVQMEDSLHVRRNYPYRGKTDGFPRYFRNHLPETAYIGVELEVNQRLFLAGKAVWERIGRALSSSLEAALG